MKLERNCFINVKIFKYAITNDIQWNYGGRVRERGGEKEKEEGRKAKHKEEKKCI